MKVNEIFYSLQGEGHFTGTPAVFVRFSGCNMKCPFCDTDHVPYKDIAEEEIVEETRKYPAKHVVLTGGEPTMQITEPLLDKLHAAGKYVQIETNGTIRVPSSILGKIDWVTCSPKYREAVIDRIDELKVVYQEQDMGEYAGYVKKTLEGNRYLQPCDTKDEARNAENIRRTVEYIKANPIWKLSLQTQKILNVR